MKVWTISEKMREEWARNTEAWNQYVLGVKALLKKYGVKDVHVLDDLSQSWVGSDVPVWAKKEPWTKPIGKSTKTRYLITFNKNTSVGKALAKDWDILVKSIPHLTRDYWWKYITGKHNKPRLRVDTICGVEYIVEHTGYDFKSADCRLIEV